VSPMPIYRCQVAIPADTGIGRDAVVNNWGFFSIQGAAGVLDDIDGPLKAFYDGWANYRASLADWKNSRLKLYDMSQPIPRAPVADVLLPLSTSEAATNLPGEVALCLSFQAARVSGAPQARRRGRIYLGPFASVANVSSTGRPDSTMRTAILASAESFRSAMAGTATGWHVISQPKPTMPMTSSPVVGGWMDDAWDTQRRRGVAPLTRVPFGS
jgi:hypothetical protein